MKTSNKIIYFFFIILSASVFAQGEANNWYFGSKAGITFNNGSPQALTDSEMITQEGCATLSDASGQLLFYTNGVTVYNKNHDIMPNGTGLMGHVSTTLSATIVPLPGSNHLYYIFTLDAQSGSNGFRYSIVDLNLNNGLGAVTQTKNQLIYTPSTEKVSVVKHANNVDYWIVSHGVFSNTFYCHLLTSTGLSTSPVTNNIGAFIGNLYAIGSMKFSPDGSKIAMCHSVSTPSNSYVEMFDFDKSTGILSNHINISTSEYKPYGVEFSPNGLMLYISVNFINDNSAIYQYDLSASNIGSSKITIYEESDLSINIGALQLGPDGKIYVAIPGKQYIGAIKNPNLLGIGSEFINEVVDLEGKICGTGLPVFTINLPYNPLILVENECLGELTSFQLNDSSTTSANWDFGDGSTSNLLNPSHTYSALGNYTVTVTASSPFGTVTKTKMITISEVPNATQPNAISLCDTDSDGFESFDLTQQDNTVLNGQSTSQFQVLYYASLADYDSNLPIENPSNYVNEVAFNSQNIIAEVSNLSNSDCNAIVNFDIHISQVPIAPTSIADLKACDNTSFGSDDDGKIIFDLTQNEIAILNGQSTSDFLVDYYTDSGYLNQILTPSSYINTNPSETIYVKISSISNTDCFVVSSLQIEVISLPVVNNPVILSQCDDDNDGFSSFNLTEANALISTTANLDFSYFETDFDAQNNINKINSFVNYENQIVSNDIIYVRVENSYGCFKVVQVNLNVSTTLIPVSFQRLFTACDDNASGSTTDGISNFDFSSVTAEIEALYPTGQQLEINYYKNIADALTESNPITNPSNYANIGYPNSQNIYVRVENQVNNECLGLGHHITLMVEELPEINNTAKIIICSNNLIFTENINAGLLDESNSSNYTYTWYLNGALINNASQYNLTVDTAGTYTVEVTSNAGCFSTRTIEVIASNTATIDAVEINDFSNNNTIYVHASGLGDYQYSLDGTNYQSSPLFTNVSVGAHTLFVKDLNGCDVAFQTIYVMGVPKFFTPNQDGINDYWTITNYDPSRRIVNTTIFDRYGKLLYQFNPKNKGWDGKYNGQTLPATDYWYLLEFENGRTIKGHFALVR